MSDDKQQQSMLLEPLTVNQALEKQKLLESMAKSFKHRKGTGLAPPFDYRDVEPLLDTAAEVVVRLQSTKKRDNDDESDDDEEQDFLRSSSAAAAQDYFWRLFQSPTSHVVSSPMDNEDEFVRAVAHGCCSDSDGYFDSLSRTQVDEMVDAVLGSRRESSFTTMSLLDEELRRANAELQAEFAVFAAKLYGKEESASFGTWAKESAEARAMRKVIRNLQHSKDSLIELMKVIDMAKEDEEKQRRAKAEAERRRAAEEAERQRRAAEAEAEAEEQRKQQEEKEKERRDFELKIKHVASDVDRQQSQLEALKSSALQLTDSKARLAPEDKLKTVTELYKKSIETSELLMRDLLTLDSVVGAPELRSARKENVVKVQSLLDEVQDVKGKLERVRKELEKEVEEEKEKKKKKEEEEEAERTAKAAAEAKTKAKAAKAAAAAAAAAAATKEEEEEPEGEQEEEEEYDTISSIDQIDWSALKLTPAFQSTQLPDKYLVTAALSVSGVRKPRQDEFQQMLAKIVALRASDSRFVRISDEELLLRMGMGQFGAFRQAIVVPNDVNVDEIVASYRRNVLQLTLPRRVRLPPQRAPADPFAALFGRPLSSDYFW